VDRASVEGIRWEGASKREVVSLGSGDSANLVLLGGDPERASPFGCSGGGRSRVCRPCACLGLRGNTNGVAEYADSRSRAIKKRVQ